MDVGNKTLSQLSDEAKERRYVTLAAGAKISGYTKDYLERLCRLNKIDYRKSNLGEYVIEIDALLAETHAILLSYQDIEFVDKNQLAPDDSPTPVDSSKKILDNKKTKEMAIDETGRILSGTVADGITYPVPHFGGGGVPSLQKNLESPFAFVGHTVVSNSEPFVTDKNKISKKEISTSRESSVASNDKGMIEKLGKEGGGTLIQEIPLKENNPIHVPVMHDPVQEDVLNEQPTKDTTVTSVMHLHVEPVQSTHVPVEAKNNEWNQTEFDENGDILKIDTKKDSLAREALSSVQISSQYHPIKTSIDATEHHEDLPLFPTTANTVRDITHALPQKSTSSVHDGVPDMGDNKRVMVYMPEKYKHEKQQVSEIATSPVDQKNTKSIVVPRSPTAQVVEKEEALLPVSSTLPIIETKAVLANSTTMFPANKPSRLPVSNEEHHLILREKHPLAKSIGFNTAIAMFLLVFGVIAIGRSGSSLQFVSDPTVNLAGVGSAFTSDKKDMVISGDIVEDNIAPVLYPFSDEIIVATSSDSRTVIIQPVFHESAGGAMEFTSTQSGLR